MKEGWEYKKLGEVATIINGKNQKAVENENGKYPICGSGGIMGYATDYLCPEQTVIVGRKGNINRPIFMEQKFWNVDTAFGIIANNLFLLPKFLFYFCVDFNFESLNKAVTIPSLVKSDLLKIQIFLPPLSEQQHIVEELDLLSSIIEKKKAQLKELDNLAQSIFYEMFGDPVTNEKGWEVKKLGEMGILARGISKHRPRNAPELLGGTMPLIQTGDIANADMYINSYHNTYSDLGVAQSKVWKAGTLCITIAANIGKCAILGFEACFPDSVVGFTVDSIFSNNEYIYFIFCRLQSLLERNAPSVAQKNINLKILNDLQIPLPPLPLQELFASKIQSIEHQKALIKQSITEVETLFNSRMDYYFN